MKFPGSLLATQVALRLPNAPEVIVMFGAGAQIEAHATLFIRRYHASLRKCVIFNRTAGSRLEDLVASLEDQFTSVDFVGFSTEGCELGKEFRGTIESADIICTATSSSRPLFPGNWVKPGTHINLIGSYKPTMLEIDSTLVHRAGKIIVDSVDACLMEAGDLLSASVGRGGMIELGELIRTTAQGEVFTVVDEKRALFKDNDVTIFKSVGLGAQDVAIANLVMKIAESEETGTRVNAYDD
jgi:ornithine cyclodeaminase/alanine dehydrogenase-like protein (mu-crystallin family)